MYAHNRRGAPWSADEVNNVIALIRDGASQTDVARALGRPHGALSAAANRLISPDRRPADRGRAWSVLCSDVAALTADTDPDWWARYAGGRPTLTARKRNAAPPAADATSAPTIDEIESFDTDLGPLILEAVNDVRVDRDRQLLLRRLGVTDRPATLQEIAEERGVSRERVRQLEAKAIARIESRVRQRGSSARALAAVVDYLADADAELVPKLVDAAETWFHTRPVWLARAVYRMVGRPPEETGLLADLVGQHLADRRAQRRHEGRRQARRARLNGYVDKWIDDAAWPDSTDTSSSTWEAIYRRRMPDTDRGGWFYSEKLSRNVYFESGLEESVFDIAELSHRVRSYQEQPCRISYPAADGSRAYYPDLLVALTDGRMLLVEIKPLWLMSVTDNLIKSAAGQRFAAERGWGWVTVADRGRTYHDLLHHRISPDVHDILTHALTKGPITWPAMKQMRAQVPMAALDVPAYAAQTNTALFVDPYRLGE